MADTIIRVENLGKKYLIKHQQQGSYTALRDVIADKVKSLGKRIISPWNHKQSSTHSTTEEFWALKDVNFEIKQGDRVGIIGRNGAGKSTLLKILSRITEPTSGRITIKGRVASLLEVGTGFHPELTGRENVFLNGAILGMSRIEIQKKFDAIVNFAEIEKFLDTPVKRYSSGMYVRLAFAVAAHLEPEILVIDEILSVGDVQFQKKCLGKMEAVAKEGRTLLFVSHNMSSILNLCHRGIYLNTGRVMFDDNIGEVVNRYSLEMSTKGNFNSIKSQFVKHFEIISNRDECASIKLGGPLKLRIKLIGLDVIPNGHVGLSFFNQFGQKVFSYTSVMSKSFLKMLKSGQTDFLVEIPRLPLIPGRYSIEVSVVQREIALLECLKNVAEFVVLEEDYYGTGRELTNRDGFIFVDGKWS